MTVRLAWIGRVGESARDLVFASDSRLRMADAWDTAQKVFPLNGLNALVSFAGHTELALPVIKQLQNSVENAPRLSSGAQDIQGAKGHFIRVLNHMRDQYSDQIHDELVRMDKAPVVGRWILLHKG